MKLGKLKEAEDLLVTSTRLFPFGIHALIAEDPVFQPLHGRKGYESFMRRRFPEKYDDLDTFEFEETEGLYYPENCLMLAEYYESEGEHERAKFLREKAAELKAAERK